MTSTTKMTIAKVAALAAGFALVAMTVAVAPAAHADTTTTTTTSSTTSLQAQIASLQAQLAASQGTSMAATTFTRSLTIGSKGSDVTALQTWLIGKGFSIAAGATGYFGAQTKAALAAYQAANGISPAVGYFGPITMKAVNAAAGGTTTTTTTTTVSGCAAGAAFSSTTGQACGTTTTTTGGSLTGGEGSINNFQTVGASNVTLGTGATAQVYGFQFVAGGSDLNISRIYFAMVNPATGAGTTRPWNVFQTATLRDGNGNTVATIDASNQSNYSQDGTNSVGNQVYRINFENVNKVVKMGATQQYFLTLSTAGAFASGNVTTNPATSFSVGLDSQGLRATDAMGIQQYSPSEAITTGINGGSLVSLNTNASGSVTLSTGSDNPQTTTLMANQNTATQGVVLNTFTLQNTGTASVEVYTLPVTVASSLATTSNIVQDLKLYQGSTLLDTESPVSGVTGTVTLTFKNINFTIPAGTTSSFRLVADIQPVGGSNPATSGSTVTVTVPGTGTDIETTSGSILTPTGASTGYPIAFAINGLTVASAPTSAVATAALTSSNAGSQQTGTFTFVFNVTSFGQTIYVASTSNAYSLAINDQTTGTATSTTNITSGLTSTANRSALGNFQVNSGQTATFTLTATLSHGGASHYFYAILNSLKYGTADANVGSLNATTDSVVNLPSNYTTNAVSISS
jgi:hypothetical protein